MAAPIPVDFQSIAAVVGDVRVYLGRLAPAFSLFYFFDARNFTSAENKNTSSVVERLGSQRV